MSTLEEMGRDLQRALELEDYAAAGRIAGEMQEEAASLGYHDLAQTLISSMQLRNYPAAVTAAHSLGVAGARLDQAQGECFGEHFHGGLGLARAAFSTHGRNN